LHNASVSRDVTGGMPSLNDILAEVGDGALVAEDSGDED
jgi:hypothetical protein